MKTIRRLTMFLGSGVLLGLALWALDRLDYLPITAWIGLGIVSALGLGMFIAIDRRRGSRSPSAEPAAELSGAGDEESVNAARSRLGGYGLASFAAVGLFMLGRFTVAGEVDPPRWIPGFLTDRPPELAYEGLIVVFTLIAVLMLTAAVIPPFTKFVAKREHGIAGIFQPLMGIITIAAVMMAWMTGISLLSEFGAFAYVYVYGGYAVVILSSAFIGWQIAHWLRGSTRR